LHSNFIDEAEFKFSEKFEMKVFEGAIFKGEIFNAKRHGRGVMIYKNKRVYEGHFEEDLR
jgi:hypothetical protein